MSIETIFGITEQDGTESAPLLAPIRYDNMDRFQILFEETHTLNPMFNGDIGSHTIQCEYDHYISLKGRESVFGGQSNPMTIADISTGALYLVFRSLTDTPAPTDTTVDIVNSFARLRYID